jgi:hypothetical protein
MSGTLVLPIERGTGTPRIVFRRIRSRRTTPPTTPTAVAPTATAGPFALLAASLTVPTKPFELPLAPAGACAGRRVAFALDRDDPVLAREARALELAEPLALDFDPELFDDLLDFDPELFDDLLLLCPLREVGLLAIRRPSPIEDIPRVPITRW